MAAPDAHETPTAAVTPAAAADPAAAVPEPGAAARAWRQAQRRQRVLVLTTQLLLLVILLVLWEVSARQNWVNPLLTSRPLKVWDTVVRLLANGTIVKHTAVTLWETIIGFTLGMAGGLLVAVAIWWSPFLSRLLDPYLVVLNALPKIALGPIFYVWLGPTNSIYGMALSISLIVTIIMMHTGFQQVDPHKITLLRTFGANQWQVLQKVVLPGSVPTLMATVKVTASLTLVGVIVGEFLSSKAGLGYLIIYGSQVYQMELVMTSIVILGIISALLYLLVAWAEDRVARRRRTR